MVRCDTVCVRRPVVWDLRPRREKGVRPAHNLRSAGYYLVSLLRSGYRAGLPSRSWASVPHSLAAGRRLVPIEVPPLQVLELTRPFAWVVLVPPPTPAPASTGLPTLSRPRLRYADRMVGLPGLDADPLRLQYQGSLQGY
ncbi:hypothetical protein [Methanosphaerula palustris]|uniref:hypothetical protein n=1 Tax=Methanosphaerula palustris TaxID=475088 RepID=UPI0011D06FCF|nr:hypothetical protein [Methanosphaerula palustris]